MGTDCSADLQCNCEGGATIPGGHFGFGRSLTDLKKDSNSRRNGSPEEISSFRIANPGMG